ncbi:MAG: 6-phosphogluconolactonase, partial [Acidimicrobiia bacterium]
MTTIGIEVFADPEALADGAAEKIAGRLRDAPGPQVSLGLAGGTSPATTYRKLRGLPCHWDRVDVWLADERWVPRDHRDSNGRMAAEALFDHVDARYHRPLWAPWLQPEESAVRYEATLRSIHPSDHPPDLVLLGIGNDGHTASLFPNTEGLKAERRWYVSNYVGKLDAWRLTAAIPLLHLAREIFFMVEGGAKASSLAAIIRGEDYPATLVASG